MKLTENGKYYLLIAALSFIFSYLIITLNFFPHFGLAASLSTFAVVSYIKKRDKYPDTKRYFILTLIFSAFLFIRSEPSVTFFNLLATVFFGLLMLCVHHKKELGILDYIASPVVMLVKSVFTKSKYFLEYEENKDFSRNTKIIEIVFGMVVTLIILAVILPLLSSANPFFAKFVDGLLTFLNLERFINVLNIESLFIWVVRLIFFFGFLYMLPRILTVINKDKEFKLPIDVRFEKIPLIIPKVVVSLVLLVFFITQLQYYFASDTTLAGMGISYSQRTREVFAQLTLVAGIVLLIVYIDKGRKYQERLFNWILGLQGVFLTLMAYKSVFEYINAWGLTYKRLYGLTFATWILGIFILFFRNYQMEKPVSLFIRKSILFSAVVLVVVNLANFDYLIFNYRKAQTGQGVDYTYLSTLSPDSLSYRQQFEKLQEVNKRGKYILEIYNNENPLIILYKIDKLQEKYENFDLRKFTLFDYIQYQQIKDLDASALRDYYTRHPVKFQ